MPEPMGIRIQPITPVWTGDAEGKGRYVRETGILGSLRWWYEALLRGLDQYACDPTFDRHCEFKPRRDKPTKEQAKEQLCLACQLFGCTGYGRRFRLAVEGGGDAGQPKEIRLKSPGNKDHRGWRIPANLAPAFRLTFLPLAPGGLSDLEKAALFYTLCLIQRYGALGAKASQGQGVVRVTDWGALSPVPPVDDWKAMLAQRERKPGKNPSPAPDLADFVGATITLDSGATSGSRWWDKLPLTGLNAFGLNDKSTWIPSAPAVRARLRAWLRDQANFGSFTGDLRSERHRLMGVVQGQNTRGANIFMTHIYRQDAQSPWIIRIFGFVPRNGNGVDQAVRNLLQDGQKLASEIEASLGGIPVKAVSYPDGVGPMLAGLKEA